MATEVAKMIAGAKLKQVTGGIEGALGVDEESNAARAKEADRKVEREMARRQKEREQIRQQKHEQRELERQKIRDKYGLSKNPQTSKSSPQRHARDRTPPEDNKKCVIS